MAILPVSQMINQPDIIGNFQRGQQLGQQQRLLREQRADQQQIRQLTPQILAGDPGAYSQAASIDPEAAGRLQSAGDVQARRMEGLIKYMKDTEATGGPQAAQAVWVSQGVPFVRQFSQGAEPTANWEEAKQMLSGLEARIAMAKASQPAGAEPTGFRELDMKARAAGLQPGSVEYRQAMNIALGREGRAATGGFGFEKVIGADGRERMGRTNPRTGVFEVYDETSGDFVPMGTGTQLNAGQAPAAMAGSGASATSVDIEGIPSATQQRMAQTAALMRQAGYQDDEIDAFINSQVAAPRGVTPSGAPTAVNPMLGVGPSPGERKYAEERGQQAAQVEFLPERGRIEAESAARKAEAEASAKTRAEVSAKQGQRSRDAAQTLNLLNEAEQILPSATGGGLGARYDQAAALFGQSTPGAQATARLNLIAAQLVSKVPRFEGPQSNIDVQFYREAAGDLANPNLPVETRIAALRTMRALNEQYATPQREAAPASDDSRRRALLDKY